jgi:hypothetical protein
LATKPLASALLLLSSTLPGFRSPWMMLSECRWHMPNATCSGSVCVGGRRWRNARRRSRQAVVRGLCRLEHPTTELLTFVSRSVHAVKLR